MARAFGGMKGEPHGQSPCVRVEVSFSTQAWFPASADENSISHIFKKGLIVNYPAAELRGIKIQNLFPCRHSCASRNPVYVGPLFSKEQAWIPTFVGMTDEVTLYQGYMELSI